MYSRADIEGKLARVLDRIEASDAIFEVEYTQLPFLGGGRACTRVRVSEVWVFGSFARGATDCGDLDLIIYLDVIEGVLPLPGALRRSVLGRVRDADALFSETAGRRFETEADFDHARRIWSTEERDWRKRVAAIEADPAAGRHARATDQLPFPLKRLRVSREEAEEVVEAIERGVLVSRFVPAQDLHAATAEPPAELARALARRIELAGKETRKVLPLVYEWLLREVGPECWAWGNFLGFKLSVGRPSVELWQLDYLRWTGLVLAPHVRRRGPNGVWVLERGPTHPLVESFRELSAWTLLRAGRVSPVFEGPHGLPTLHLFTSRERAQEEQACWEDDEPAGEPLVPSHLSGPRLLQALAFGWQVSVDLDGVVAIDAHLTEPPARLLSLLAGGEASASSG